jgi:hypothetical protein
MITTNAVQKSLQSLRKHFRVCIDVVHKDCNKLTDRTFPFCALAQWRVVLLVQQLICSRTVARVVAHIDMRVGVVPRRQNLRVAKGVARIELAHDTVQSQQNARVGLAVTACKEKHELWVNSAALGADACSRLLRTGLIWLKLRTNGRLL